MDNETTEGSESRPNCRTQNGRLSKIVVLEVNQENLNALWPYLMISIKEASFISIDLEMSGLGDQKGLSQSNVDDRYRAIRDGARTRSIISVGISTFKMLKRKETREKKRVRLKCQVFNILTMCATPFVGEPDSLEFLVDNSFDFNRLFKYGIRYYGRNKEKENPLKFLWSKVLERNVPLIFHNGLVDLVFLYQHFYADLPETLPEFITNISDWFEETSANYFDSKYFSEYYARMNASYLEYVFRKCQRDNAVEASLVRSYISMDFDEALFGVDCLVNAVDVVDCHLPEGFYYADVKINFPTTQEKSSICSKYATYGFCRMRRKCPFLHNIDAVLDSEEEKQTKVRSRRKRRYDFATKGIRTNEDNGNKTFESQQPSDGETSDHDKCSVSESQSEAGVQTNFYRNEKPYLKRSEMGCHRAGVDSFMTGFSVLFMSRMSLLRDGCMAPQCGNRIPLPGKAAPLIIRKYEYTEKTEGHLEVWESIAEERTRIQSLVAATDAPNKAT